MHVVVANFGRENHEWAECLRRPSVCMLNTVANHQNWLNRDRVAFIKTVISEGDAFRIDGQLTARPADIGQASKYWNAAEFLANSVGDLWLHRAGEYLWWTRTIDKPVEFRSLTEPVGRQREMVALHKPTEPWRNRDEKGRPLLWEELHPAARAFFAFRNTQAKLSTDNADYARYLIAGEDLNAWHQLHHFRSKSSGWTPVVVDWETVTAGRMVKTALATVDASQGEGSLKLPKLKLHNFETDDDFRDYVRGLLIAQEGRCALTGLLLALDDSDESSDFRASLDRIDSAGHYERGNLQVVCRFANFWKGNRDNERFKELIAHIKASAVEI